MTDRMARSLMIAVAVGGISAGVTSAIALSLGFGLSPVVWALGGTLLALIWWSVVRLSAVTPAEDPVREPQGPPSPVSRALDRRTRQLAVQLRGAQTTSATTVTALHATISALAAARGGERAYPPLLAAYLNQPPRPIRRAHLRALLRELTDL